MSRYSSIQKYNPFQITIDPSIAGTSGIGSYQLPLSSTGGVDYRFRVDWGDGTEDRITDYSDPLSTHTYSGVTSADTKTIKIYGKFDRYNGANTDEEDKLLSIDSFGDVPFESISFYGGANITGVTSNAPILENASSLLNVFYGCPLIDVDVSSWDVSNITNTSGMFGGASAFNNGGSPDISGWTITSTNTSLMFVSCLAFNQPIDNWDVSNVTDMYGMLSGCDTFNQPIGSWDTSSVKTMKSMLSGMDNFNQDIGNWDVSSVGIGGGSQDSFYNFALNSPNFNNGGSPSISGWTTTNITSTEAMFAQTAGGTHTFNQPIGPWDVSNVITMKNMFLKCSAFDQDIGSWDVSGSINYGDMFNGATSFNNGGSPSISGWTMSLSLNPGMRYMFNGATSFNQPIGAWDVSLVHGFRSMFAGATSFNQDLWGWHPSVLGFAIDDLYRNMFAGSGFNNGGSPSISGWTITTVQNNVSMRSMFAGAPLNQPIDPWNVSKVTTMEGMFSQCPFFNQDIGSWNVTGVTNMDTMFWNATDFNNGGLPNISGWTIGSSVSMNAIFKASSFNQPINAWDVTGITNMVSMFEDSPFNQDLSSWDVSNNTNIGAMFGHRFTPPGPFNQDLSSWNVGNKTTLASLFINQSGFTSDLSSWDVGNVTSINRMFTDCTSFSSYLGGWNVSGVTDMDLMLDNTAITTAQYNDILTGWTGWNGTSPTKTLQPNVDLGATGLTYLTGTTAEQARTHLLTGLTWTINGDIGI